MKKNIFYPIFAAMLLAVGCTDTIENDLNLLERRVSNLEAACNKLNSDIRALSSVVSALEEYDFVTNVRKDVIGGETIYTISFTDSDPVVIYNGRDAENPVVGVKMNTDGKYYWSFTSPGGEAQFIRANDGSYVAATASSPQFRIKEGMWEVSYDEGRTWTDNYKGVPYGNATGESPQSFFESVIDSAEYVIFKMKDSSAIVVPSWSAYEKIEETVRTANENYKVTEALIKSISQRLFINGVSPIVNTSGDTTGYRMTLSDGTDMSFYNGISTNRPEIGVSRDPDNPEDTAYYWTVRQVGDTSFTWALSSGKKVRANAGGATLQIAAYRRYSDGLYYWGYSLDGGDSWVSVRDEDGNLVRASLTENAVMDSIRVTDEYVYIRQGSEEYKIERYQDFSVQIDNSRLVMAAGETKTIKVSLTKGNAEYEVLPVVYDGFVAKAAPDPDQQYSKWTITVTAPSDFSKDSGMSVIISNGRGLLKTYNIGLVCKK